MSLLGPELMARLERLQLRSRSRLVGRFGGEHVSKRFGNTIDFADFREYHPGDDFRRIDYHVMARLDQVLIKLYEADDEVTVRLMIDTSASMKIGGKLDQAKRLAAAMGFVALIGHDAVTVHAFPGGEPPPRFSGRASIPAFFGYLEQLRPLGVTPFAQATGHLLSQAALPGITVVFSDLLTPEWRSLIRLRSSGSDVVIVHVLCRDDWDPDYSGDLDLIDTEEGSRLTVSVTEDVARSYRDRVDRWVEKIIAASHGVGARYIPVDAEDDVEDILLKGWRREGILR